MNGIHTLHVTSLELCAGWGQTHVVRHKWDVLSPPRSLLILFFHGFHMRSDVIKLAFTSNSNMINLCFALSIGFCLFVSRESQAGKIKFEELVNGFRWTSGEIHFFSGHVSSAISEQIGWLNSTPMGNFFF